MSVQTQDRLAPFHAAKSEAEAKTEKLMVSIDRAAKAIQSMGIDHDSGFVLVARRCERNDEPNDKKPKRGEAA